MDYMDTTTPDIVSMPRGGPDASWLDRRLQTNRLEYLDRDDVDDLKRKVIQSLDRQGRRRFMGAHKSCAPAALREVTDIASPKILELGPAWAGGRAAGESPRCSGDGHRHRSHVCGRSRRRRPRQSPTRHGAREGRHGNRRPDGYYDLAVFALSLHHLAPERTARVVAEGTRAANKLLIIDLRRWRPPLHLVM